MDKEQLIKKLQSSHLYYKNGEIICQVCFCKIDDFNWSKHSLYHLNNMENFEFYYNKIRELERK